jgi:hypothetical protein
MLPGIHRNPYDENELTRFAYASRTI